MLAAFAAGQAGSPAMDAGGSDLLSCSPAPCVIPPTQLSFGPDIVADAPVVADPSNPEHLIVGGNDSNCPRQDGVLGFFLTSDGGSNWSNLVCMVPLFHGNAEYIPDFSPILAYDRNGVAYIGGFYLDDSGETSFGFEGFEKSSDGITWSTPAPALARRNHVPYDCWMAADTSVSSPFANSVYVSCVMDSLVPPYTIQMLVAHSNDGGATWEQVNVVPPRVTFDTYDYTAMTVGKDGTVYLAWQFCNTDNACDNGPVYMVFSKSSDGGNTWSKPNVIAPVTLVYPLPNTQNIRDENTPAIGVDNSTGPHSGNLYVVMYNWTGTFMQVQVVRSTDGGNTWSKPVPVAPGFTHDQFFPWLSVSPTGLVGVSWLDRRNDPNNTNYQAFATVSADGGRSFQPGVELTPNFSDPNKGGVDWIGDYTGDTWDGPNYFVAAWMDNSNSQYMQDFVGGIRLK
ncbi:MAG TPA: sialidase family protein [Terriglobales bacterium]|nr:sialidase family protein [Terriglobales bacterium]